MFVVNWGQKQAAGVFPELGVCSFCHTDAPCSVSVRYYYVGMLWVCNFCTGKIFSVCCKHCGKYRQISWTKRWKVSNRLIPFRYRFGFLVLVIFASLFGLLSRVMEV